MSVAIRMLAALSLALSMLAALAVTTAAAPNPAPGDAAEWDGETFPPLFGATPSDDVCAIVSCDFVYDGGPAFDDGAQEVYFPAVGNADESTGLGAAQTSITIQNIEQDDAYLFIYVGWPEDDDGIDLDNWDVVEYAYLSGGASKTFQASDLEIPEGEIRPVVAVAYHFIGEIDFCGPDQDLNDDGDCDDVEFEIDDECFEEGDFNGDGDCDDIEETIVVLSLQPVSIAGVAKQAVAGENLPYTSSSDSAVSGYNGIVGRELGYFDQLYFPIVQTNCGPGGCWNSILRIANMGTDDNAAVTVRFFPADDGSGSLQTRFQLQGLVDVGETWSIDLSEWVPEGWVGSAHVYTDDAIGAIVDRVKVGTDMWITNTASNATSESIWQVPGGSQNYPYVLFAPDVRTDYNGWNTGINVANTVEDETDVSIQYFGSNGNAPAAQTRRLAAHGMTYFYNPSDPSEDRCEQPATDVPGCEFIGGAIILSSNPVAVAVDGVKYFGNDANVGQAFSYSATGNAYDELTAALVQKGSPATGMGATSGINVLNPNAAAATVEATWLNPSGFGAANFGSSIIWVPAYSTGFVYTMFHNNLPNGFVGSAWIESSLPVVGTTANVDYQVGGDGTAIFNLSNHCGFFRQAGECVWRGPLEPSPVSATLTKVVVVDDAILDGDEEDSPLGGVLVSYTGEDDNGYVVSGSGLTGANGAVTFAVPAGVYSIELESLPAAPDGYVYTAISGDEFVVVEENSAVTVTNEVILDIAEGTGRLTKQLVGLPEEYLSLASEVHFCPVVNLNGIDPWSACVNSAVVSAGYGELIDDPDNVVSADVPAGEYTICTSVSVWVADFDTDGELDEDEVISGSSCENTIPTADPFDEEEPIIVLAGETTTVVNDLNDAVSDFAVFDFLVRDDETDLGIPEYSFCVYLYGNLDMDICTNINNPSGTGGLGNIPAGTHLVAVQADGYEQEAAVAVDYSPVADLADGNAYDEEPGTQDVIVALDPIASTSFLDVIFTISGSSASDASTVGVYQVDGVADADCTGTLVTQGNTSAGTYSVALEPGAYCVEMLVEPLSYADVLESFTLDPGDPAGDTDIEVRLIP